MAQDPWKRAHQLSQLKQAGQSVPQHEPPAPPRRRISCGCLIGLALLFLLALGLLAAWLYRGWWIPRYRDKLPEAVVDVVTDVVEEPRVTVGLAALESGLGVELCIGGDYLELISATRGWNPEWKLTDTGDDTLRLTSAGIKVYVIGGKIQTYELELETLFSDERWAAWRPALENAALTPYLTWTALVGGKETPAGHEERIYVSDAKVSLQVGTVHPVYVLHFYEGWLRRVEGRIQFEPGMEASGVRLNDVQ